MLFIGIDIGTSYIKVMAVSREGESKQIVKRPTPTTEKTKQWPSGYDADKIYLSLLDCIRELRIDSKDICTVAVSSMGEPSVLINKNGKVLCPAIAWYDTCSEPQLQRLKEKITEIELHKITGQIPTSKFSITKLMWIKENHAEVFDQAVAWMSINEYIIFKLTGERVVDYSIAARTMAFDIFSLNWSSRILDAAGIPLKLFPTVVPGGTAVGLITQKASEETGLPLHTTVCTGGHDHLCASIGANAFEPGYILDSMGTSEATLFTAKTVPMLNEDSLRHQYSVSVHCGDYPYKILTSFQACGASIEFSKRLFGDKLIVSSDPDAVFSAMTRVATEAEQSELLYYPFLRGDIENPGSAGTFIGVRDYSNEGAFVKAVFDGLVFEFNYKALNSLQFFGQEVHTIRAIGGPSKSEYYMQRKSDVSKLVVETMKQPEAACLGAALLGGLGTGEISFDKIKKYVEVAQNFYPHQVPLYDSQYDRYVKVRPMIHSLYR